MATPRVAHRYAKSLIDLAQVHSTVDEVAADLQTISGALEASDELGLLLASPIVQGDKKRQILEAIFKDAVSSLSMSFIRILVEKGRESILPAIADAGTDLVRRLKNIQVAEVITAAPLDDATRNLILAEVKKIHEGEIELQELVDEDIMGGFILKMDDRMLDASTRRQLQLMRRELTEHDYEPEF